MKDVLEEIVAHKRLEVERFKQAVSPSTLYDFYAQSANGVRDGDHCRVQAQISL